MEITAAVGLVMALATFALTEALVEDLITPIVAAIIGEPNFSDLHRAERRLGEDAALPA